MTFGSWFRSINQQYSSTRLSWHKNRQPRCCHEGARTHRKVEIPKLQRPILSFLQNSVGNTIHHYNRYAFIILVLFTVSFYHSLFSRYLDLTECLFLSDILVPFPDSSDLYSCVAWYMQLVRPIQEIFNVGVSKCKQKYLQACDLVQFVFSFCSNFITLLKGLCACTYIVFLKILRQIFLCFIN